MCFRKGLRSSWAGSKRFAFPQSDLHFPRGSSSPERSQRQPLIPVARRSAQTAPRIVLRTCAGRHARVHFGRSATNVAPPRRRARTPCCFIGGATRAAQLVADARPPDATQRRLDAQARLAARADHHCPSTPLLARASGFPTLPPRFCSGSAEGLRAGVCPVHQ